MTDPWGQSSPPQPPPPLGRSRPHRAGTDAYRTATGTTRRSGAFRDTLIVAAVAVAGVVGLIVWSGGDVPDGDGAAPAAHGEREGPSEAARPRPSTMDLTRR